MDRLFTYVTSEWKVITQAPLIFITGAFVIAAAVYAWVRHQFGERIESLEGRLKLRDDRLADYENKLNNASPDEAKARIERLEAQIAAMQPRSLTPEQRDRIRSIASQIRGRLAVSHDGACSDCNRFSMEIANAFRSAGWQVGNGLVIGPGNPPAQGIGVCGDPRAPESAVVQHALQEAGLRFAAQPARGDTAPVEILITAKIA